jgi:glycosyltransferase involved in cell wall biosynthesis
VETKDASGRNVLLVRSAEFAATPALPRFAAVLADLLGPGRTFAVCWRSNPLFKTPYSPSSSVNVSHFELRADSRSLSGLVGLPLWWFRIVRELVRGGFALVQASDVFSLVPVLGLRPLLGYRVIADVRDHIASISGTHWAMKATILGWLEALLLRLADAVIVVDETRKELLPERVVARGRVVVVRNLPLQDAGVAPRVDRSIVRINFSGYLSRIRGAEFLCDAIKATPQAELDIVGGTNEDDVRALVSSMERVVSHGRVSHAEAMEKMRDADVVALLYDPGIRANRYAAPNKFYEAMMLGRPVLVSEGTPMAVWVRQSDCGYVVPYGDVGGLCAIFRRVAENREEWHAKSRRARELYDRELRWPDEAARLKDVYRNLLGES